ncbi:MAG: AIPR family protein [Pseudomonadota bacterium]
MKDQILESYVNDFSDAEGFKELSESDQFERFVNYCVVSKQYPREFDIESLSVGGGDDIGSDGVAITVNGNIVQSEEEIEYLLQKNGYIDASFAFIQSKSSPKFKGDQVGTLIFGIKSFFDSAPAIPENEDIKNLRSLKDKIYKHSINFDDPPELRIYFVTTGEWKEPEQITGRVERELADIKARRMFRAVTFTFYDANRLKETYRELRRKTIKEVDFPNHVALPVIPGVRQSFVGSLSATEYVRLISDSDGNLQKSLFEDNVRDFQGTTKVNADIKATLTDTATQAALAILNNGITIIAKKIDPVGAKLKLTDFQIVNGCQSSHVLFEQRAKLKAGTHVIVKFIETTDQDLSGRVIRATNKQTHVTDEAFESLAPFHKDLEEFYNAHSRKIGNPIFYERRSRQYDGSPNIKPSQVVTLAAQTNAYVATTLAQPHSTHRYYGELLEANRSKLFRADDNKEPYFLASLMLNRLDRAFKSGKLPKNLQRFRFQILYMAHSYNEVVRQKKKGHSFDETLQLYDINGDCFMVFKACGDLVEHSLRKSKLQLKEAVRSRDFSNELRTAFEAEIRRKGIA